MTAQDGKTIALCLSGGGFRATLFHLGSLRRLNEFGILSKVDAISSVSGGSITNGVLAKAWPSLKASEVDEVFTAFDECLAEPIREFCREDLRTQVLLWDRVNPINWPKLLRSDYSVTDRLAEAYAEKLGLEALVSSIPNSPRFIFMATNFANGGDWRFECESMGDWYTGYADPGDVTLAQAVAASSAYPIAFPPLQLNFPNEKEFIGGEGRKDHRCSPDQITLTDGGVYDNLGLEPVREDYDYLLVSDAGTPLGIEEDPSLNMYSRVTRSLDIIWNQVGAQRKRWLIDLFQSSTHDVNGAYWGLSSKVANYWYQGEAPGFSDEAIAVLSCVRTDLDSFSDAEIGCLENQGYSLANVAIQKWVPNLRTIDSANFTWPEPGMADNGSLVRSLSGSHDRGILRDLLSSFEDRIGESNG